MLSKSELDNFCLRKSGTSEVYRTYSIGKTKKLEMPGIEPGAFHMQSERSTTELHPRYNIILLYVILMVIFL